MSKKTTEATTEAPEAEAATADLGTFRFSEPIHHEGKIYTVAVFRKMIAADYVALERMTRDRKLPGGEDARFEKDMFLTSRLADIPEAALSKIDGEEFIDLILQVQDFLESTRKRRPPRPTSPEPSPKS